MASDSSERTDYKKGDSKVESKGSLEMIKGGYDTGGSNGPTGSSRSYPKGKGGSSPHNTDWNPQKLKASTYGICGVDCG